MFAISKLLSAITQPMFWLALWCALALLLLKRWRHVSTAMLWAGLLMLGLLGFVAVPDALLRSLESRYPTPNAQNVDKHVGMIVLGGAIGRPEVFKAQTKKRVLQIAQQLPAIARSLQATQPFAGWPIIAKMIELMDQRTALTIRRLTEGESDTQVDDEEA